MANKRNVSAAELQAAMQGNQGQGSDEPIEDRSDEPVQRVSIGNRPASGQKSESRPASGQKSDNPFFAALNAARRITERRPQEDQAEEWNELKSCMSQLDAQSQTQVVFRLVVPVLREETTVQSLFAAARASERNLVDVAFKVGAILKMLRAEGMLVTDLLNYGTEEEKILSIRPVKGSDEKSFLHPTLKGEVISAAAAQLQAEGRVKGARELRVYLNRHDEQRVIRQARRAGMDSPATEAPAESTPEATDASTESPDA